MEKFDSMIAISTFGSVSLAVMGVVIDYTILREGVVLRGVARKRRWGFP